MQKSNLKILFATLIPDFIYQFFSQAYIDKNSLTCMELEDLRNSILNSQDEELYEIKKFLMIENGESKIFNENNNFLDIFDEVDADIQDIESEYYHKYTPGELKFIFEKIIYNIDKIYKSIKLHTDLNPAFSIGFKFTISKKDKKYIESNFVIEFTKNDLISKNDNNFYLEIINPYVEENIKLNAFFVYNKKDENYFFDLIEESKKIINLDNKREKYD